MDNRDRMGRAEDYVFGLMDAKARERAERDMETDAEFRNCVMEVAERLRRLHASREAARLPETTWREIGARIAAMPQMASVSPGALRTVPGTGSSGVKQPFAHQFGGWRGAAVAACLIAALGAGYLAGLSAGRPAPAAAVALLADPDGRPAALAELRHHGTVRVVPLAGLDAPEGGVPHLWARHGDDGPAIALGALARAAETVLEARGLPAPPSGLTFEITLEDKAGERPRGPVLASGAAVLPR